MRDITQRRNKMKNKTKKIIDKLGFGTKMLTFAFMGYLLIISLKTIARLNCIETTDKLYMIIIIMFISFWLIKQFWEEMKNE